ncbi:lipoate--protein ligase family protein [Bifidobacterium sp. 82T10]|uniref:Lipoate--protein ligase family protein n=1 Tax=Bifidobacterium miconis TaxID=2834435 RepID=A0ABS6WC64_9BIFI|nr:lipoate--protein ligase family protein [Bifidobacterium miconis]MBW3091631.1 lipoate--protein ligase family protein [Bifidobacterium miconis]
MRILRGECKTPGGKLVGVNVTADPADGRALACRLDGDFFVEGDDAEAQALIDDVERTLVVGASVMSAIARHDGARLVGTDAAAIETAYARAMGIRPTMNGRPAPDGEEGSDRLRLARNDQESGIAAARNDADGTSALARNDDTDGDTDGEADRWHARWAALRPLVVHDAPRDPAEQMAVDEQWARDVAAGLRPATVRFWEWAGPAVVVGRFQSIPDEVHEDEAAHEGIAVVRRCTGGGAMFIEPGNTITYSLYAPLPFVDGIDVETSYRLCDQWLIDALCAIGVDARFAGLNDIASSHGKIGGAAQRRFPAANGGPGAVLHHVTMAYDIDAGKMARVLNTSSEKMSDKAVKSARKRVDPLRSQTGLAREAIIERFIAHLIGRGARPLSGAGVADRLSA